MHAETHEGCRGGSDVYKLGEVVERDAEFSPLVTDKLDRVNFPLSRNADGPPCETTSGELYFLLRSQQIVFKDAKPS